jgi:16S rRNA U1498 N3-methylase RsmE
MVLEDGEVGKLIPRSDRRWEHVKNVLKKGTGDTVAAGIACGEPFGPAHGALGLARIEALDEAGMVLSYGPQGEPPPLAPIRLVLGFPRPIQAGRIFKDLCSLGVADMELCGTDLGEKSYLESDFFRNREFRRSLLEGAEQATNPRLPRVETHWTLARCLDAICAADAAGSVDGGPDWKNGLFVALHPGPGAPRLGSLLRERADSGPGGDMTLPPVTLAIGSERGWSDREVELLSSRGFAVCGLGERILKTETAALAAAALTLEAMGRM